MRTALAPSASTHANDVPLVAIGNADGLGKLVFQPVRSSATRLREFHLTAKS